jgi:hypothetical protein
MIKMILELLNAADWYGQSEAIDIAKGKYSLVHNYKELKQSVKREYYGGRDSN